MTIAILITIYVIVAIVAYVWSLSEFDVEPFSALGILLESIAWPFVFVVSLIVLVMLSTYDAYYSLKNKLKK